jgi:hypothetical protein
MKKFITGWNEDPCFFTILIKIDLATLYVDSDLDMFEIKSIYAPRLLLNVSYLVL